VYMKANSREGSTINRQQLAFVIRRGAPGWFYSSGALQTSAVTSSNLPLRFCEVCLPRYLQTCIFPLTFPFTQSSAGRDTQHILTQPTVPCAPCPVPSASNCQPWTCSAACLSFSSRVSSRLCLSSIGQDSRPQTLSLDPLSRPRLATAFQTDSHSTTTRVP
jgi:hypothetical protein